MSRFLVLSFHHGLLPLALRLRSEGHEVDVVVWRRRFEKAWGERVDPKLRHQWSEVNSERLAGLVDTIRATDTIVLSDINPGTDTHHLLASLPKRLIRIDSDRPEEPLDLCIGFWFDGEKLTEPHLLVYDLGAQSGGMGMMVPGGLTLIVPSPSVDLSFIDPLTVVFVEELKSASFVGLVNIGLGRDPYTGALRLIGMEAGWPRLHLEAWLSSTEQVGKVLSGAASAKPSAKYTVVVPVSIPPWPSPRDSARIVKVDGLPPVLQGWFFWFDMSPDDETQELWTAGLDGLVGVARGEGAQFETARLQALGLAQQVSLPEKQFRIDVGQRVPWVLAQLERQFGLVL